MKETWKQIGNYEVSSNGKVRNGNGKEIKPRKTKNGYLVVDMYRRGCRKAHYVHRLVGELFFSEDDRWNAKFAAECTRVIHIDGNKENNSVSNLKWVGYAADEDLIGFVKSEYVKGSKEMGLKGLSDLYGVSKATLQRILNS